MNITVAYLQRAECYPCTRREARTAFGDLDLAWIGLGYPLRRFRFDSRCQHRPKVAEESIVCEAVYSARREGSFCAYAVRKEAYPAHAKEDCRQRVLPGLRRWLQAQIAKPDTAVLGYEYRIVEWTGTTHRFHSFTWR